MDKIKNKKTISGIALAAILVGGMFVIVPQSASADLTALDKIGTIINILTNIQNTVNNIFNEVTDPEHGLAEIKREVRHIEGNITSPDFGLEEIKREVRHIEGNITSPDFGLEEIKNEIIIIDDKIDNLGSGGAGYVPFKVVATGLPATCDADGDPASSDHTLTIDGGSDFILTAASFDPAGTDETNDSIEVRDIIIDSTTFQFRSANIKNGTSDERAFDIMGISENQNSPLAGSIPITITAIGAGSADIVINIRCAETNAGTGDITFAAGSIIVGGWKQASDTITATYA